MNRNKFRMRSLLIAVLTISAAQVFAQAPAPNASRANRASLASGRQMMQPVTPATETQAEPEVALPPDTPVITLDGVCDKPQPKHCKTVITRAEMDAIMNILVPDSSPAARRLFVIRYARMLAASSVASRKHLDKDQAIATAVRTQTEFARMQVLGNALYRQMDDQAKGTTDADIQQYYNDHPADFEQVEVERLLLPRSVSARGGAALDDNSLRSKAEALRVRAAAGEDFAKLQQEAFTELDIKISPPATKLPPVRRVSLPRAEQVVFNLKLGEVSPVLDSFGGLVILKLISRGPVPMETLRAEIVSAIRQDRLEHARQAAQGSVKADFNLAYLGVQTPPDLFPAEGLNTVETTSIPADLRARMMSGRRRVARRAARGQVGPSH
jgi:parvulin-like peptidyl-prolyl cis-trans isomerase-like protein